MSAWRQGAWRTKSWRVSSWRGIAIIVIITQPIAYLKKAMAKMPQRYVTFPRFKKD